MDEIDKIKYSIVVPVYNEEENVKSLHMQIIGVMDIINNNYEIIFINDGSTDNSLSALKELSPLKIINFRRNFGQTAALDAGIKATRGEVIITLDGDGQNPPSEITKLLKKLEEGYDLVSGWRYKRKDPFTKKVTSRGADFLRGLLIKDGIHDSGCTLKAYRKECFEDLDLYGEMHRFIPAILKWKGFKVGEVKVEHRERKYGKTKYNSKRIIKGFLDMWMVWFWRKYSARPLHLFGSLGVLIGGAGFTLGSYLAIARILGYISLQNSIWPLVSIFMLLVGLQLFISGILADIAIKTYYGNKKLNYSIKNIIENE